MTVFCGGQVKDCEWYRISRPYVASAHQGDCLLVASDCFASIGRRPVGEILSVALYRSRSSGGWARGCLVSCFKELPFCVCHSRGELNASAHSLLCISEFVSCRPWIHLFMPGQAFPRIRDTISNQNCL